MKITYVNPTCNCQVPKGISSSNSVSNKNQNLTATAVEPPQPDSSGVYICKSIVNHLRHGNFICKSEVIYHEPRHLSKGQFLIAWIINEEPVHQRVTFGDNNLCVYSFFTQIAMSILLSETF